jgi:hypothetical protein
MHRFAKLSIVIFAIGVIGPNSISAQKDSTQVQQKAVFILPLVYYTPETRWVFAFGGATNFNLGNDKETYESQAAFGMAYSLRKQFLSYASWRIFTSQNKNLFSGEVGWYDYVYFFYGIGNKVKESDSESYNAKFPRVRWDYFRLISSFAYLGVKSGLDNFQFSGLNPDGKLENKQFIGVDRGWNVDLGPAFINEGMQFYFTFGEAF